jgi:hypothetical protein
MKPYIRRIMATFLLVLPFAVSGLAQATQVPAKVSIPMKVLVVISRYEGDKKVSSLPYTLAVTSNDRSGSIRMGSQIPIPSSQAPNAFSYQNVGTNIDCSVSSLDENRFKVEVTINDTSVMERRSTDLAPTLRSFTTNNSVILRDGHSAQFTAAADRTTGEVVKVDVTLTIDK